uniref:Uncharacterized protein n=1 Tax=Anguilla anguilla TaxID=7936 RepID=A0A0E9Y0G0_ANGAN
MTAGTNTSDSECGPRNIPVYIIIVSVLLALAVILAILFILWKFLPLRGENMPTDPAEGERMTRTG